MTNAVILVGRITHDLELQEDKNGRKYTKITIAVGRDYKNEYGMYDTDFIDCVLSGAVADTTCEFCKKGDIVGIKGRLETSIEVDDNGENKRKTMVVIADRVSFLSSKKEREEK